MIQDTSDQQKQTFALRKHCSLMLFIFKNITDPADKKI